MMLELCRHNEFPRGGARLRVAERSMTYGSAEAFTRKSGSHPPGDWQYSHLYVPGDLAALCWVSSTFTASLLDTGPLLLFCG
jgi:hypothetical protein